MSFEEFKLSEELMSSINRLGFTEPTEIQAKSIPHIMAGKDVIGESATGSGKTLAFGCAIVDRVQPRHGVQALVLAPTRELAEQVSHALQEFSHRKLRVVAVYGGVSINPQMEELTRSEVVVATPGRLLDHLERGTIDLSRVHILVLDEVDRMLDMGFIDDVERIIQACPRHRQTLCFSATVLPEVKDLADRYMKDAIKVAAHAHVDPRLLRQEYYNVSKAMKLSLLAHLLKNERTGLAMVFCNSRNTVDFVVRNLKSNGINSVAIHGGFSQNKRSSTMHLFNNAKVNVLVCTDVAARGLHIENVSHVYNYDIPKDARDYVHRIGRTARAGAEGKAVNILAENDYENFGRVESEYSFDIVKMELPELKKLMVRAERPQGGFHGGFRRGFQGRRRY